MSHGAVCWRGSAALLVIVAAVALALVAPAASSATPLMPSMTIVGPGYMSTTPPPTAAAPVVNDAYVQLYLQDNGWGADRVRFSADGGTTWSEGVYFSEYLGWYLYNDVDDVTLQLDGVHTLMAEFSDDEGATWGASTSATTLVDQQSPVVQAPGGYWNNRYAYKISARDQVGLSGVERLWYRVDAGAMGSIASAAPLGTALPLTATVKLAGETGARHSIDYIAKDYAGNYSGGRAVVRGARVLQKPDLSLVATSAYVIIDRTAPKVRARGWDNRWHRGSVSVSFSASDGMAGVDRIQYSVTGAKAARHGAWTTANAVVVTQSGRRKVWYRAIDDAMPHGNASVPRYVIVKILR
jgi:hypothetical protein